MIKIENDNIILQFEYRSMHGRCCPPSSGHANKTEIRPTLIIPLVERTHDELTIAHWIPYQEPTSEPFYGVDRTLDVTRMAGLRYDGSTLELSEALLMGCALIHREGEIVDTVVMNPNTFDKHIHTFASITNQYTDNKLLTVIRDARLPEDLVYLIKNSNWKKIVISGVSGKSQSNLICLTPSFNCVVKI